MTVLIFPNAPSSADRLRDRPEQHKKNDNPEDRAARQDESASAPMAPHRIQRPATLGVPSEV